MAWWRFGGVRHRRLAHLAARILPPPAEALVSDETAREWVRGARRTLFDLDFILDTDLGEQEQQAPVAAALLDDA